MVMSSMNLMMLDSDLVVQAWVSSIPVLSMMVFEVLLPKHIDCGLSVRKSRIQLQRKVSRPSRRSFLTNCWGIIMFKVELKPENRILTYVSLDSAVCWVWEMAISVEKFRRYTNWSTASELGKLELTCLLTSHSKHFIMMGVSALQGSHCH